MASTYQLQRILLRDEDIRSAYPNDIVWSNRLFVDFLIETGLHLYEELPCESVWSAFVDRYFSEVYNGGHEQFLGNCGWSPAIAEYTALGLRAMGADNYLKLFEEFKCHLDASSPTEILRMRSRGGFDDPTLGPASSRLSDFDRRVFELGPGEGDLHIYNGNWLKSLKNIDGCPRSIWQTEVEKLVELNPFINERRRDKERQSEFNLIEYQRLRAIMERLCNRLGIEYPDKGSVVTSLEWGLDTSEPVLARWFTNRGSKTIGFAELNGSSILIEKDTVSGKVDILIEE